MPKRTTETERLIGFAMNASQDALSGAIESLNAIRNNRFPPEKKSRKPRKAKEPKEATPKAEGAPRARKAKSEDSTDEAKGVARKCASCGWAGQQLHPEPCPDCGEKTAAL